MDFREIEKKWKKKWEEEKIFESNSDNREKFFVNVAYPYVNGYGHLGHLFTFLRTEILARFKRMQGYNVLFPQGFHATGQPIVAAAKRIKEKEEKQIKILKDMGIPEKDIDKFSDVNYWIEYFPEKWKEDLKNLGFSIDWRRSFITTEANKPYDSFVKWQFMKLKEKNLIYKGSHPVIFCEKCGFPIGDHDRVEGEGVVPEEVILLKFELGKIKLPVMTYRPETIYGVTNLWINPDEDYVQAKVSDEEILKIEAMVNNLIRLNIPLSEHRNIPMDEAKQNEMILQASMFNRALTDSRRKTVSKKVQAYFDKKYGKKVPPETILNAYYKTSAIKTLLKLVDEFPESAFCPPALSQAGALYTILNKPEDAKEAFQRLQKNYPKSAEAENVQFMLANSLLGMGRRREAIRESSGQQPRKNRLQKKTEAFTIQKT